MPLYSNWLLNILNGTFATDWDNDTIKVALFSSSASSYVCNSSGITYWSQIASSEITGTGYTASGQALTSLSINFNGHNPSKIKLTAAPTIWTNSTITARLAVVYKWTGIPATSPVICWIDFGENKSTNSTDFEIDWNTSGIIEISSPN